MWINRKEWEQGKANGNQIVQQMTDWMPALNAQLKAIAESQKRLEVNVGERLAALETNQTKDREAISTWISGLELQIAALAEQQQKEFAGVGKALAEVSERLPTKLFAEVAALSQWAGYVVTRLEAIEKNIHGMDALGLALYRPVAPSKKRKQRKAA